MEERVENLIPISITEESDILVSARDLHDFLGIKTNFRLWYPKMMAYGFLENEDYQKVYEKINTFGGGQTVVDYMMTTDMAKEISTIQQSEKGRQARTYFLGVEKTFKSAQLALRSLLEITENNFRNSTTFSRPDYGKKGANEIEQEVIYNEENIVANYVEDSVYNKKNIVASYEEDSVYDRENIGASYVEYSIYDKKNRGSNYREDSIYNKTNVDSSYIEKFTYNSENIDTSYDEEPIYKKEKAYTIVDRKSTLKTNFRDTSKLFGIRENLFVNWLLLNNYCYRDKNGTIKPYARVMDYFYMREFVTENGHSGMQTLVNPRGREFFRSVLVNENIIKEEVKLLE